MWVNPSSPREWRDTEEVSVKICAGRIKDNSPSNSRPLKLNTFFQICSHTAALCQNRRSLWPWLTFTASYQDNSERKKYIYIIYNKKKKNTIGNCLYLKILLKSVQLLIITTVQDSIETQANIFFAELPLSSPIHVSQKFLIYCLFLVNSKCQGTRSYLVWYPSHLVTWT